MGVYVVTGAASGIGAAAAEKLRAAGHEVIGVDRDASDGVGIRGDLSTPQGRAQIVSEIAVAHPGTLDGAVLAAGLGPVKGAERTIAEVNVSGVVDLLTALRPALAAAGDAKVVVFGSNSTTSTPLVSRAMVTRLIDGDIDAAVRGIRRRGPVSGPVAYAASKIAVTHWVRKTCVGRQWAGEGVRVNVIAPGPVLTPLLRSQLEGDQSQTVRSFPVPIGEYGTPDQIADWVLMMLSPAADFMVGSVVTVDGGTEALLRARHWPSPMPLASLPTMLWRMYRAPKEGQVVGYRTDG